MKYYDKFPTVSGVGRMFVGNVSDDVKFHPHDVITWQNVVGKSGVLQWMGWEDEMFAGMNVWMYEFVKKAFYMGKLYAV